MAKRIDRTLVFRAEFQNRIVTYTHGNHVLTGRFVVEVSRWENHPRRWAATINGDRGQVVVFGNTAAMAMHHTRRNFERPLCDWVVGHKTDGQWRPVDDVDQVQEGGAA